MQVTPNNILPQVSQVAFQPNVGVPQSGIYQSLQTGMDMVNQPINQRIALEQLEQTKINTELAQQRLEFQLQEFDFRKQQNERAITKEIEEYRQGVFSKTDAILGMPLLTDEDEVTMKKYYDKYNITQDGIKGMLDGNEFKIRGFEKELMRMMAEPEVQKIFQRTGAAKTLADAVAKNPNAFDLNAVRNGLNSAHTDPELNPRLLNPTNFFKRTNPDDELQEKFGDKYNATDAQGKIYLEKRAVQELQTAYPGQQVIGSDGNVLPEWQERVDYILNKGVLSDEAIASRVSGIVDLYEPTTEEERAVRSKAIVDMIQLGREIGGTKGAQQVLLEEMRIGKQEAAKRADERRILEKARLDNASKEEVARIRGNKVDSSTYIEARKNLYSGAGSGEAQQGANLLYQQYDVDITDPLEAVRLQREINGADKDVEMGVDRYLTKKMLPDIMKSSPATITAAVKEAYASSIESKIEGGKILYKTEKKGEWNEADINQLVADSPTLRRKTGDIMLDRKEAALKAEAKAATRRSASPAVTNLGTLVASGEGSPLAYNRGNAGDTKAMLPDDITLAEVMRRQSLPKENADRIFAVGSYQVIPSTMREAVTALGINPNQPFTQELQNEIFNYIITEKRPDVGKVLNKPTQPTDAELFAAQKALAMEFASIGVPEDMQGHYRKVKKGESYYAGGAGNNKASIDSSEALSALKKSRTGPGTVPYLREREEYWRSMDAQPTTQQTQGSSKINWLD